VVTQLGDQSLLSERAPASLHTNPTISGAALKMSKDLESDWAEQPFFAMKGGKK